MIIDKFPAIYRYIGPDFKYPLNLPSKRPTTDREYRLTKRNYLLLFDELIIAVKGEPSFSLKGNKFRAVYYIPFFAIIQGIVPINAIYRWNDKIIFRYFPRMEDPKLMRVEPAGVSYVPMETLKIL